MNREGEQLLINPQLVKVDFSILFQALEPVWGRKWTFLVCKSYEEKSDQHIHVVEPCKHLHQEHHWGRHYWNPTKEAPSCSRQPTKEQLKSKSLDK